MTEEQKKPKIVKPPMETVVSSNISSVGYDAQKKLAFVSFTSGTTYMYKDVEAKEFEDLLAAKSIGSHLAKSFRAKYAFEKLEDEDEPAPQA